MKKSTLFSLLALVVAILGAVVAIGAYYRSKVSYLYDEDDFFFDNLDEWDLDELDDTDE